MNTNFHRDSLYASVPAESISNLSLNPCVLIIYFEKPFEPLENDKYYLSKQTKI